MSATRKSRIIPALVILAAAVPFLILSYALYFLRPLELAVPLSAAYDLLRNGVAAITVATVIWVLLSAGATALGIWSIQTKIDGTRIVWRVSRAVLGAFGVTSVSAWIPIVALSKAMEDVVPYEFRSRHYVEQIGSFVLLGVASLLGIVLLAIVEILVSKRRTAKQR